MMEADGVAVCWVLPVLRGPTKGTIFVILCAAPGSLKIQIPYYQKKMG